jgi:hypothetical protein
LVFRGPRRAILYLLTKATGVVLTAASYLPKAGNPTLESFPTTLISSVANATNPSGPTGTSAAPYQSDNLTVSAAVAKTGVDNLYMQLNKLIGGASGSITLNGQTEGVVTLLIEAWEMALASGFRLTSWTTGHNPGQIILIARKASGLSVITSFAGNFLFYEINYDRTLGMVFTASGSTNMDFDNTVPPSQVVITGIDDLSDSSTLSYDISTDILSTATMSVAEVGGSASDLQKSHLHSLSVGGLDPGTLYTVTITVFGTGGTQAVNTFEAVTPSAPAPTITGASADLGAPDVIHVDTDVNADTCYCSLYTGGGDYIGDFYSSDSGTTHFDINLDGQSSGDFIANISASNSSGTGTYEFDFSL